MDLDLTPPRVSVTDARPRGRPGGAKLPKSACTQKILKTAHFHEFSHFVQHASRVRRNPPLPSPSSAAAHSRSTAFLSTFPTWLVLPDLIPFDCAHPWKRTNKRTNIKNKTQMILKLDLKLGALHQTELVHSLEKNSIASLLDGKISSSIKHLLNLRERIEDTSSKVLVTGDLNAGKSTFCNALLRRKILPEDQQPCTSIFCEVLDARENGDWEGQMRRGGSKRIFFSFSNEHKILKRYNVIFCLSKLH